MEAGGDARTRRRSISLERVLAGCAEPGAAARPGGELRRSSRRCRAGSSRSWPRTTRCSASTTPSSRRARLEDNQGRLGVFWHTQGSGQVFSMVFFSQKVLRKVPGNWSFVVVTDRTDLDDQIYKNFVSTGALDEAARGPQAGNGAHLQRLLSERPPVRVHPHPEVPDRDGSTYPVLSDRDDIIVMADEAHRTQYDTLAQNMRLALPNAAFLAFTGTPLLAGEEKTREVVRRLRLASTTSASRSRTGRRSRSTTRTASPRCSSRNDGLQRGHGARHRGGRTGRGARRSDWRGCSGAQYHLITATSASTRSPRTSSTTSSGAAIRARRWSSRSTRRRRCGCTTRSSARGTTRSSGSARSSLSCRR